MVRVCVLRAQPAFGWEAVITPVVDHALGLEEVDPDRIALLGLSQAGYWVPRAVAFERRIAAAIVDPGVWDVSASWYSHISGGMKKQLAAGDRDRFNSEVDWGTRFTRATRGTLAFGPATRASCTKRSRLRRTRRRSSPSPIAEGADGHCEPRAAGVRSSGSSTGSTRPSAWSDVPEPSDPPSGARGPVAMVLHGASRRRADVGRARPQPGLRGMVSILGRDGHLV